QGEGHRAGQWFRQQLSPLTPPTVSTSSYRQGGVYVVIGGAGGIGAVWSEYMMRTYGARLVWIGRRQKDQVIQAKLDRLAELGPAPLYLSADASDRAALQQAYQTIKGKYAEIHGLVHSAIALLDKSLTNMDEAAFQAGLAAKVDVCVRMAQVFAQEPLDCVLFFSSMTAFARTAGQSNYAAGCVFTDAFAQQLGRAWARPDGRPLVKIMNWGYWGNVGVASTRAYQERMARAGVGSIEPQEGMAALECLLAGPVDQLAFVKMTRAVDGLDWTASMPVDRLRDTLLHTASTVLGVDVRELDPDTDLHEYGFDTLTLSRFAELLNQVLTLAEARPAALSQALTPDE